MSVTANTSAQFGCDTISSMLMYVKYVYVSLPRGKKMRTACMMRKQIFTDES